MAANKGAKEASPDWFNPYAEILYRESAKAEIEPAVAAIVLDLCSEQKLPAWAIAQLDLKLIRAAAP